MGLIINSSLNVSEFEFLTTYDPQSQTITIVNQSTYITSAASTQGINFVLTSPSGLVYYENTTDWGVNSDITPALPNTAFTNSNMPTFNGVTENGLWRVAGTLKDGDGTLYNLSYNQIICKPAQCPDQNTTSDGCVIIGFTANCALNKVSYEDLTSYTYQGLAYSAITFDVSMSYPLIASLSPILNANVAFFSLSTVYDGLYNFTIDNAATYYFSNTNTNIIIHYTANQTFTATCKQNLCGILCVYNEFLNKVLENQNAGTNNSRLSKYSTNNLIALNAYVNEAVIMYGCGDDLSDVIDKIEALTGSTCDCSCGSTNAAVVNTDKQVVVTSDCGDITVTTTQTGTTTTIELSDYSYVVESGSEGLTVTLVTDSGNCTKTYTVTACLDSLVLCSSTMIVNNGNNGNTQVAAGSTITDIVTAQNTATQTLYTNKVSQPTWANIADASYSNSWVNLFQTAITKNEGNWVTMRGTLTKVTPASSSAFYTLDADKRPAINTFLSVTLVNNSGASAPFAATVSIAAATGVMTLSYAGGGTASCWFGLDGLQWSTVA
jgi:hypothetical protein